MYHVLAVVGLLLLVSCADPARPHDAASANKVLQADTVFKPTDSEEQKRQLAREQEESSAIKDSVWIAQALQDGVDYALKHTVQNSFKHEFESIPVDSSFSIITQMVYGHLFASDKKHLVVKRMVSWGAICNVLVLDNERLRNVCENEQLGLTFLGDTLRDVNGDGFKDYLVNYYPSSGCCRRNSFDVFLYQPSTGDFTAMYHFINPTFSPKEKIIRGIEYGHPGEVGIYKYSWNNLQVDTVEFIYPDAARKGRFFKTKRGAYLPTEKDGVVLHSLPQEYRHIESIEWFLRY